MAFIKRINYLASFTGLFVLTGISLTFLILFILYAKFSEFKVELDKDKATYLYDLKKEVVTETYKKYTNKVLDIQHNRFFTLYLDDPTKINKQNLKTLFKTLVRQDKTINQLRYISKNGYEIIRVDRKKPDDKIELIPDNKLQNKVHRDYFKETVKNKPSQVYVSKLDLNIENKKIEVPYKPVLRFAVPIFHSLENKGIVVVNIFGEKLLENLLNSDSFKIDVYDQDGHILVSNDPNKNQWSRYLNTKSKLEIEQFIFSDILIKNGEKESLYIGYTQKNWIEGFFETVDLSIIFLLLFIMVIGFVFAYMLSRIPKRLFDELESQQNMLVHQSKVAAVGEMTGMLAHQWRQPLNTVSVLLQEIELKKSLGLLDDNEFNTLSTKMKHSINYMSKTIDNFRDFFKVDKKKSRFNIKDLILNVYGILEVKLKNRNIKFEINVSRNMEEESLKIESFEGEFKQVIINILSNAIEAFEDKNIKNKYIRVTIYKFNEKINISIEDNGGGIKKQMINKLFEPYSSTKLEKNGTGLGLYMSKMILQKSLKGNIEAENTSDGARFVISLKNTGL